MLGLSKPIPGNSAVKVSFRVHSGAEDASIDLCGQLAKARFPKLEFCANGVGIAVVRLKAESTHACDLAGLTSSEIIYRTASEVVFTKPSDQVTPPIFRPRNSA
jgi:hypothetical protein